MKHAFRNAVCFALLLCLMPLGALADGGDAALRLDKRESWVDGKRHVVYYQLEALEPSLAAAADAINQAILDTAQISRYQQLLPAVQEGGTGLTVETRVMMTADAFKSGTGYLSILVEAQGKMLQGPPSHRYYPMVFRVETGERIGFDALFSDPEGARAYIEGYLAESVAPQLSTYLENNQLFPVPYESFGFSNDGHLVLYYPHEQLSFLSGKSGAVAFRFSELWEYLDTSESSIALAMLSSGTEHRQYAENRQPQEMQKIMTDVAETLPGLDHVSPSLGMNMEQITEKYDISIDSGFYPGGAYLEAETPELLGTYLITDEAESYLAGILTGRIDMYGIETGKTDISQAKYLLGEPLAEMSLSPETAEMYLVCPGTMLVYSYPGEHPIYHGNTGEFSQAVLLTLYADDGGVIQYIKKSLQ